MTQSFRILDYIHAPCSATELAAFITEAFATATHKDGTEAELVHRLRNDPARALRFPNEFVALDEQTQELVGHVLLSRTTITTAYGDAVGAVLLAPICVKRERRSRGIGSALIDECIRQCRLANEKWLVVLGDPAYYGRFGFRLFAEYGLTVEGDPTGELLPYSQVLALTDPAEKPELLDKARVDFLMGYAESDTRSVTVTMA